MTIDEIRGIINESIAHANEQRAEALGEPALASYWDGYADALESLLGELPQYTCSLSNGDE